MHDLFIHMQFGLTPDKIGLVFLGGVVPLAACAPLFGLLADKIVSPIIIIVATCESEVTNFMFLVIRVPDSLLCVDLQLLG